MFRRFFCRTIVAVILLSGLTCQCFCIKTSAESVVLMEQRSGRVLYERNADEEKLIASITKIMTAVVAIEHGNLDDAYTVRAEDMTEGSSMYLRVGEVLTLEELLYGLLLASGNDAALAVAHCVSGDVDAFVELMNRTADRLGMKHSGFANPNGLDAEGHYSSARDMAILSAYALENETFRRIASTMSANIGGRYLQNHNKLLRLCEGCIGLKTGYTRAAGRTLVSAAQREGMTLICVTLKDGDDWNDHLALFDYGFDAFRLEMIAGRGQKLACMTVRGGAQGSVFLAAGADLCYPVAGDERLTLKIVAPVSVSAPVAAGQIVGKVYACLDGEEVACVDLVAMEAVSEKTDKKAEGFRRQLLQ